jgi:hypothetical protein
MCQLDKPTPAKHIVVMLKPPPPPATAATTPIVDIKDKTVTELAKELAPLALATLHEIASDPELKPAARVAAANAIIERAEGKVGIIETNNTTNYTVVINQINRAMGKVIDVTPVDN